jgi:hypothetical protein
MSMGAITDLKLYYRTIALKTAWYWQRNRHEDKWNRTEEPDTNTHKYNHVIFNKDS